MNLYHWQSKALQDYLEGDIIVLAETLKEAKEKAEKFFKTTCYYYSEEDDTYNQFLSDIAEVPDMPEVILISGSA